MAGPQPPATSYDACLTRYNYGRGLFVREYNVVTPVMAEHVNDFISMQGLTRDAARAHAFDYVTRARDLTIYTAIMGVGLATIPEVDEDEMVHIENRIRETGYDMPAIQTFLFGTPLDFTNEQAWRLAGTLVDLERSEFGVRALAFMMGSHARLGAESPLHNLEPLSLQFIARQLHR